MFRKATSCNSSQCYKASFTVAEMYTNASNQTTLLILPCKPTSLMFNYLVADKLYN